MTRASSNSEGDTRNCRSSNLSNTSFTAGSSGKKYEELVAAGQLQPSCGQLLHHLALAFVERRRVRIRDLDLQT